MPGSKETIETAGMAVDSVGVFVIGAIRAVPSMSQQAKLAGRWPWQPRPKG